MPRPLYSIDIAKCKNVENRNKITEVFKNAIDNSQFIKLNQIAYEKMDLKKLDIDYGKLVEIINNPLSLEIRSNESDFSLEAKSGDELEVLIDAGAEAYFFPGKVLKSFDSDDGARVTIRFPEILYTINRRTFFRYSPGPEKPLPVEFEHSENVYDFYVNDISGGGFSIRVHESENNPFSINDTVKNMNIYFMNTTVYSLSASILHISEKNFEGEPYRIIGFKFTGQTPSQQDVLVRNIFTEHRDLLNGLQKKL